MKSLYAKITNNNPIPLTLLIVTCSLLLGCANPFEPPKFNELDADKGYFSLSIGGVNTGRTILPADVQDEFAAYTLEFFAAGTHATPEVSVERTSANLSDTIELDGGTWDLYITAYLDNDLDIPAAHGSLLGIAIGAGATVNRSVVLTAIIESGTGTYSWDIDYPADVTTATMTITPYDGETGTAKQTLDFIGWPNHVDKTDSITLNTGYYRVVFNLRNSSGQSATHREVLHVFKDLESSFAFTFASELFKDAYFVTSGAHYGAGTLYQTIIDAPSGSTIIIDRSVGTIELDSSFGISKDLTIEGNGVTLTTSSSWGGSSSQFLYITSSATVTMSRIWFKDITTSYYGVVYNDNGTLNLESCIFSGNRGGNYGGAVFNRRDTTIRACTFYGNTAGQYGAAIHNDSGTLTLEGNLFYGNTAPTYPVVTSSGIRNSNGYNVVDVPFGNGNALCGWIAHETDILISNLPLSPITFKVFAGGEAAGIIDILPVDYPEIDFFGNTITAPASAGAVQSTASGSGYILDVTVNNKAGGSVNVTPAPDSDGFVSGTVTITAAANGGYVFSHWLVNGEATTANPLYITLEDHTLVQAVFTRQVTVTDPADTNTAGTLRYALANAQSGDTISIDRLLVGDVIEIGSPLPQITQSITIEGNGVTITTDSSWNPSSNSYLLRISSSAVVNISRIWFKDITTNSNGALSNNGVLHLESCIFSDNRSIYYGGIISNAGSLNIKGCTFYGNVTGNYGGAINNDSNTLILEGNLFYGNTAPQYPVVSPWGTRNSNGYNIVDAPLGTNTDQSAYWTAHETDRQISNLPVSTLTFKVFPGGEAAGVITSLPVGYPTVDFYGNNIIAPAAAGAVQGMTNATGFNLNVSVNNSAAGTADITGGGTPDNDGLVSGAVTITASANGEYGFSHWLVNGVKETDNPLTITLTAHTFVQAVFSRQVMVTDPIDYTNNEGTLRRALNDAQDGDIININIASVGGVIEIGSELPQITKNIIIKGNGVIITTSSSWNGSYLLYTTGSATVTMSRIWFKDIIASSECIIYNYNGTMNLESCIFSGNYGRNSSGGAIRSQGPLTIKGCTFYGNTAAQNGGAIYHGSGTLTLEGNLFYGNTAPTYPVVTPYATRISNGYNVVDAPLGTNNIQSGWVAHETDRQTSSLPVSPLTFKVFSGGEAAGVITSLPADYPTLDFYGDPIINGAAAGAVQATTSGTGYILDITVNNSAAGDINITGGTPDADGFVSGTVNIEAIPNGGCEFSYWLVNGVTETDNPLSITLTTHTFIQTVFTRHITVNNSADTITSGTLRYALANAQNGDVINIDLTASSNVIEIDTELPQIIKNVTIQGNGVTITTSSSSNVNYYSQLLPISGSATVTMSRIWFKNIATNWYGVIYNNGSLNLESCIFSGNSASGYGGAIFNRGPLTIQGCTFYGNTAVQNSGGAIYHESGTLTLEGNLFYGNTAGNYYPVVSPYATRNSNGYNIVDAPLGTTTNQSAGWTAHETDKTIETLLGNNTTSPFVNAAGGDLSPVPGITSVIPYAPANFPATDFYGNPRTYPGAPGAIR